MSKMEAETELANASPASPEAAVVRPAVSIFAGIAGAVSTEQLQAQAQALAIDSRELGGIHFTLAYPSPEASLSPFNDDVDLLACPLHAAEGSFSPWAELASTQMALLRQASEAGAQAAVLLYPDLAALAPGSLQRLLKPVLAQEADLVLASYAIDPFEGLLNAAILSPLTRALYGRRARFPLAPDFAVSARLTARLAMQTHRGSGASVPPLLWPTTVAAAMDAPVLEVPVPFTHATPSGDMELSAVITQLVGSAFAGMETHAPLWQRVRFASHAAARPMPPSAALASSAAGAIALSGGAITKEAVPIDPAPMVNSFLLGSRSLQDVWGLVLPPVTLLDLKRLAQLSPDRFRMPDELWVRIVYDFALSFRLRTINRNHLLGALTPLYLGWVASYVNEAASEPGFSAEACAERLARAFEEGKPYLVRRWRWPDRFNP